MGRSVKPLLEPDLPQWLEDVHWGDGCFQCFQSWFEALEPWTNLGTALRIWK